MNSLNKGVLLLAACGLLSVAADAKIMEDTVAVVNGTPILLSDFQKEMDEVLDYWRKALPAAAADPGHVRKLKENTLEQLIDREVLYQEGVKLKLKVRERDIDNGIAEIKERFLKDDEGKAVPESQAEAAFNQKLQAMGLNYAQFRERLSRQIMARKVVDEAVKARIVPPTENEVKDYFGQIKSYMASGSTQAPQGMDEESAQAFMEISRQILGMTSERVRVSRILIRYSPAGSSREKKRALDTASQVRQALLKGASTFAEVARDFSEEAEYAVRGGDIGFLVKGVAPVEFEKTAFSMAVGEISEPVETELGYFLIRVQEKRASEEPDFEKFKEELGRALMNMSYQKELEKYVKALKAQAVIEKNLPAQ